METAILPKNVGRTWKNVAPQNTVPSEQIYQNKFKHTSEDTCEQGETNEWHPFWKNRFDALVREPVVRERRVATQPAAHQFAGVFGKNISISGRAGNSFVGRSQCNRLFWRTTIFIRWITAGIAPIEGAKGARRTRFGGWNFQISEWRPIRVLVENFQFNVA